MRLEGWPCTANACARRGTRAFAHPTGGSVGCAKRSVRTASIALRHSAAVSVYRAMVRDARLRRAPHHEGLCVLDPYQPYVIPGTKIRRRTSAARESGRILPD